MSLSLNVRDYDGNIVTEEYPRINDCQGTINYEGYQKYIEDNYKDLHCMDLKAYVKHLDNYQELILKDWQILNSIHVQCYVGLKNPDDIWDSLCKRIYNFGFIGNYSRICDKLENGYNYILTFDEFSHIYPFMRSCIGNAASLRRMNNLENFDIKTNDASKLFHDENKFVNFIHKIPENNQNLKNITLLRRSVFNESRIYKRRLGNPPGSEWTHLSIENDLVKLTDSYRKNIENNLQDKYGVYEKYLFCVNKHCPGKMKIILDCIHNVVIISMINPHFRCLETHKRHVFDIVRKLFIIHNADLELIDKLYRGIPRKYGLTYVEAWTSLDEFKPLILNDLTPNFFNYDHNYKSNGEFSWSSTKKRGSVLDFFKTDGIEESDSKRRKIEQKKKNTINKIILEDRDILGIKNWQYDLIRYDQFSNFIKRDEWEFHLSEDKHGKLREIYRIWRKDYFEIEDYLTTLFGSNNPYSFVFACNKLIPNKVEINNSIFYCENNKLNDVSIDEIFLNIMKYNQINCLREFQLIVQHLYTKFRSIKENVHQILRNPANYITPYPLNSKLKDLPEINEKSISSAKEMIFVCLSNEAFINSDEIIMYDICDNAVIEPINSIGLGYNNEKIRKLKHQAHITTYIKQLEEYDNNWMNSRCIKECYFTGNPENKSPYRQSNKKLILNRKMDRLELYSIYNDYKDNGKEINKAVVFNKEKNVGKLDYEESLKVIFIKYKIDDVYQDAYLIIKNIDSYFIKVFIEKLLKDRIKPGTPKFFNLTDDKFLLQISNCKCYTFNQFYIDKFYKFVNPISKYKLFESILTKQFDANDLIQQNKIYLPRVRMRDSDKFELKSGLRIIARTAGNARNIIKKENELFEKLNNLKDRWLENNISIPTPHKDSQSLLDRIRYTSFMIKEMELNETERGSFIKIFEMLREQVDFKNIEHFQRFPRRNIVELVKELNKKVM